MDTKDGTKLRCADCGRPMWAWQHNTEHPAVRLQKEAHIFVIDGNQLVLPTPKKARYTPAAFGQDMILLFLGLGFIGFSIWVGTL